MGGVAARRIGGGDHGRCLWPVAQGVHGCAARDSNPEPADKEPERSAFTGFMDVRTAAQTGCAYSDELCCTGLNCNPKCNPER
jgi:hypothetical protein